jgi:hypothetical protein
MMSETLFLTTYSMWRLFRDCRMAFKWRYLDELVPLERDKNLYFGSTIHECLRLWHEGKGLSEVFDYINRTYCNRDQDVRQKADWHHARAMMKGYASRYPTEAFTVVALEKKFEGAIVNPDTGAASRSFVLGGKVDGIVQLDGRFYLLEHKTTSQLDGGYLERLWSDFQITLYSWYLEQCLGITISGIIYNVLVKTRMSQSQGETEDEYTARCAELIAKSKTGKTSAKRKLPESDEAFQARLEAKYVEPEMFHREKIFISRDQFTELRSELWELSKSLLEARRRGVFYRNNSHCFHYGRPCPYFTLCRSGGNPNVIEAFYEHKPANEELNDTESTVVESVF